jgi:hypothetical protein
LSQYGQILGAEAAAMALAHTENNQRTFRKHYSQGTMNIDCTRVRLLELPEDAVTSVTRVGLFQFLIARRSVTNDVQSALKNNRSFMPAVRAMMCRHVAEEHGEDWSKGVRQAHKADINARTDERPEVMAARTSLDQQWDRFFACFELTKEQSNNMSRQIKQINFQKRKYKCIVDPVVLAEVSSL